MGSRRKRKSLSSRTLIRHESLDFFQLDGLCVHHSCHADLAMLFQIFALRINSFVGLATSPMHRGVLEFEYAGNWRFCAYRVSHWAHGDHHHDATPVSVPCDSRST